ncbi:MAG: S8 family serine peptidase, partial [Dehalococcoidia bacterium]
MRLPAGESVEAAAAALSRRADVEYAEPNWISQLTAVPDDPRFGELHGFNQANDADIDMPEGWDIQTGSSSVIVAVVDSGVAIDHPDLANNIWVNDDSLNASDTDGNGFVDDTNGWDFVQNDRIVLDYNGHGTHVAGTIGAQGNNALGVPGVNWDVSIMAVRAADANGSLTDANIANSITYACANGADILNGSFGGSNLSKPVANAVTSPACANTLMVFAAGNESLNLGLSDSYPCELHLPPPDGVSAANVLCVAATGPSDELAGFSNRGGASVHLAAPGVDTLSSWPGYQNVWGPEGFDDATDLLFDARWGDRTTVDGSHPQWNRTTAVKDSGTHSLTDSPAGNYALDSTTTIRRILPFSLASQNGCRVDYDALLDTEEGFDPFLVLTGTTTATTTNAGGFWGSTGGAFELLSTDISMMDGQPTVYLRFALVSDEIFNFDGVYLDDVLVKCLAPGGEDYNAISGTSMATPHVAGVAGLLVAQNPSRTVAQLKSLLTSTVDPVASLTGRTITGGRLNACKALGGTCGYTPPPPSCAIDGLPPGGAIFAGAHQGGGSVCFVLSSDFTFVQGFRAEDIPGNTCLFNFVQRTYGSPGVPVQGFNRAFSNTSSG